MAIDFLASFNRCSRFPAIQQCAFRVLALCLVMGAGASALLGQSTNSSITGSVLDASGAPVPQAEVTLTAQATGEQIRFTTGGDGLFDFPNLQAGAYELRVSARGFGNYVQGGIILNINQQARRTVSLKVGSQIQTLQVSSNISPLNFDNAEVKGTINPQTIAALPLIVGGNLRSAAAFVVLEPGVTAPSGFPDDARVNGGVHYGDEAVIDGVSLQDGANSQSGMDEALYDHPLSPESVSEVSVLGSNYQPRYGATTASVITTVTKSGTNQYHGTLYEHLRNTDLNARQFGVPNRPEDIENDFGGNIGGPLTFIPGLRHFTSSANNKTFFFVNYDGFRIRGGATTQILTLPPMQERTGDFSDWVDSSGNLIPVYDPATTQANPNFNSSQPVGPNNLPYLRKQFMGCNGNQPNVICSSDPRLQNSLAAQWFKFLPAPTYQTLSANYVVPTPVPNSTNGEGTLLDIRVDDNLGSKDHFAAIVHYHGSFLPVVSELPLPISTTAPYGVNYSFLDRFAWDHSFSPSVVNNFNFGYNDIWTITSCLDNSYASQLPQISGVPNHNFPPALNFADFQSLGCNQFYHSARPDYIPNDELSVVRGSHLINAGGEYRAGGAFSTSNNNGSGTFNFSRLNTGLIGINSGSDIASFLLGMVDNANVNDQTVHSTYNFDKYLSLHVGDTWKITRKMTLDLGLRWDRSTPTLEKYNHLSFFDPLGTNPGAGNRLGSLAFAGTEWGSASFGARYPEKVWNRGFAPRVGLVYAVTQKTVVHTGYGIFYQQAYYPGWNDGESLDGFNASPSFSSGLGGMDAAFLLSQGFPQNYPHPPLIDPSADNGQGVTMYRPFDANRLPYTQQWNLTIEHQFTNNFYISAGYIGNKGTRLLSNVAPLNALNPSLLSMGQQLFDQFQPGQTSLDGVAAPYANWASQSTCAPTVAQALLPYPQYCSPLAGENENAGSSIYNSFQLKAEKRYSHGVWLLGSYTDSKLLSNTDDVQVNSVGGAQGQVISPFQRSRNKSLSSEDIPQTLSVAAIYALPFGRGQRFLNTGGAFGKLVSGWQVSSIFRASSGIPFYIRSSQCNVPSQFAAACIPALLPGADPFAQSKSNFNPGLPLLNAASFESPNSFNFYLGQGPRVSNIRGFGYHNQDLGLSKNTQISERMSLEFRGEFFNVWNWHSFVCQQFCAGAQAFNDDVSSPNFGVWNGSVSAPRNIQLSMKLAF
ncbi:MAG TPA: carboxypeptidase-like regulatory domain-containing protein [Terriglobia bacterium]|nr:carboxypeptidase-like regulatory domain-containing protein [Terriglobia bacterium]